MTAEQLVAIYMPMRRKLLEEGVPVDGWTVYISPHDAADIELERPPIDGSYEYGARWEIDATVPAGELRIVVGWR